MASIFSDGFESGDISAWSGSGLDGGDVSVTSGAKLHGNYGLNVLINDTTTKYVQCAAGVDKTRVRIRFYLDPNSLTMGADEQFVLFTCVDGTNYFPAFQVKIIYSSGYKIFVADRTDWAWSKVTSSYAITDAPHCIEVDWTASSGAGANNGTFTLWIDGVLKETMTGVDSDTESVRYLSLGAIDELDAGTSGTIFLDDFSSNDDGGLIGAITSAALTGTIATGAREGDIIVGGKTIILTLTGDIWVASGATFNAQRQAIIDGLDSAQAEATGWDAEVKAKIPVTDVVRTSDTVVTITLSAEAAYAITAAETITATIPTAALLSTAAAVVVSPTFLITPDSVTRMRGMLGVGA